MISLPPELTAELSNEVSFTCYAIEIAYTTPIRYNNSDVDIFIEGNKFTAFPFNVTRIDLSAGMSVQNISIDFDNVSTALSAVVLNDDIRGTESRFYFVALDASINTIGYITLFVGYVAEISFDDTKISITFLDEMLRWRDKTLNTHTPLCPWRFKDPNTCKYSGTETWCDKTYDRCTALGNTVHFGGFRYLPDITEKEIWWGRVPK